MKKLTKKAMIDFIEKSGMVLNFSRSYFEHRTKETTERYYIQAVEFVSHKK